MSRLVANGGKNRRSTSSQFFYIQHWPKLKEKAEKIDEKRREISSNFQKNIGFTFSIQACFIFFVVFDAYVQSLQVEEVMINRVEVGIELFRE